MSEYLDRLSRGAKEAAWLLGTYEDYFCDIMHTLAGFPSRKMSEIRCLIYDGMPKPFPLDEILASNAFLLITRGVKQALEKGEQFSYAKILSFPLSSRLDICTPFTEPESAYTDMNPDTFSDKKLQDGFVKAIFQNDAFGKYALPLAYMWANMEFAKGGYRPFVIQYDYPQKLLADVKDNDIHALKKNLHESILRCRQDEQQ